MPDFMPGPPIPIRCECGARATWRVYNRKVKGEQYHCETHVPPVGTPRIKRLGHRPSGFWTDAPSAPGVLD